MSPRMRNILDEIIDKIKTHNLCSANFSEKSYHLWNYGENVAQPHSP